MPTFHIAPGSEEGINLNRLAEYLHRANQSDDHDLAQGFAKTHAALFQAHAGYQKALRDKQFPYRPMIEARLAEALIEILKIAGACDLDIGDAVIEKFNHDQTLGNAQTA